MHSGDLVGVADGRSAQLAIVDGTQGTQVRLLCGVEGKPSVLPLRQVQLLSPLQAGVDPPKRLGSLPWQITPGVLETVKPTRRAWGTAWLLLLEDGHALSLAEFTDLVCGSTGAAQRAACWLELMGTQQLFRLRQDLVSARPLSDLKPLRRERWRRQLALQREQAWLALLKTRQPVAPESLPSDQRQRLEQLQQLAAAAIDVEQLDAALRQSLSSLNLSTDRGDLRHLLLDLGLWDPHRLLSLQGSCWSTGFSTELEAEATRLLGEADRQLPGDSSRLDLCDQHSFTIDDDDTYDIDDGLALERRSDGSQRLWIHVADPGRLVAAGSPLDLEARRRGSSLYLAEGTLPMFPEGLSHGPFSLRRGVRSAAWSVWVDLDETGEIGASGILRTWVQPTYRLSYADADELIDLAPPEDPDLALMEGLLQRRRRWRQSQGALLLDLPEGRIQSQSGEPELVITEPSPARQMVAEAMILAGTVVARFGVDTALALPYRSQLPAELPPAAELAALPEGPVRFAAIKRCLSRGLMGSRPAAHFSLGLPAYVQATSPIRRYGDLVVQRQIALQLDGGLPLGEEELQELLNDFETAVREGIGIAREDQRHWQQVWFERHRGHQWRGQFLRWLRPQDRLALVRIDELALDLAADVPAGCQPGTPLLLRVRQVDSLRDLLRLVASGG